MSADTRIRTRVRRESGKHQTRRSWRPRLTLVEWTCIVYLIVLGAGWVLIARFGDSWWPATVPMFGPRWLAALPAVVIVPWALAKRRWLALPLLAGALVVVAVPIMGWRWSWSSPESRARDLRVVTFNIGNSPNAGEIRVRPEHLRRLYDIARADVMMLQECGLDEDKLSAHFPDAMLHSEADSCVISRLPILQVNTRSRDDMTALGAKGLVERVQVLTRRGPVNIVNLHLTTVRWGLQSVVSRSDNAASAMRANTTLRRVESAVAATWLTRVIGADPQRLPLVVVGDFNMPVESAIYRHYWGEMGNAFSDCGRGYGYTKFEKYFAMRIDHVLYDRSWQCMKAIADQSLGGDHRATIVDLKLR
jgi:vancomycin resistance protein VanJ